MNTSKKSLETKHIDERISLDDAVRIAEIMEADDIISHSAMSCRRLLSENKRLEKEIVALKKEIHKNV